MPAPGRVEEGCIFADRCGLVEQRCRDQSPPAYDSGPGRRSRCHFHERAQTLPRVEKQQREPAAASDSDGTTLITAAHVSKTFHIGGQAIHGLVDTSLELRAGETVGLVGESGSGKTTFARVLVGLTAPDDGATITLDSEPLPATAPKRSRAQKKAIQIVFQNPDSALNRRHSVRRLLSRALSKLGGYSGDDLRSRLRRLISDVRLSERHLDMKPVQLSGGLKQRVAIARAFAGDPRIVVCDEPTSALDVSVQAAILNLLTDLQRREEVSYLFISHDLGVVRYLSDRIVVLYLGKIMEIGPASKGLRQPAPPLHRGAALGGSRRSTTSTASGSASMEKYRAPPTRPAGAPSRPAVRARSARSARRPNPSCAKRKPATASAATSRSPNCAGSRRSTASRPSPRRHRPRPVRRGQ